MRIVFGRFGVVAQRNELDHERSLDWFLQGDKLLTGDQTSVSDINHLYREWGTLYESDFDSASFEGAGLQERRWSIIGFLRIGMNREEMLRVVCNSTPTARERYAQGVLRSGHWREVLNIDAPRDGRGGIGNKCRVETEMILSHDMPYPVSPTISPLGVLSLKREGE
jgi:1,4-alpha-glucan branching enzyme